MINDLMKHGIPVERIKDLIPKLTSSGYVEIFKKLKMYQLKILREKKLKRILK